MVGAVLALGILTTAARWQAIATLPGSEAVPSIVILFRSSELSLTKELHAALGVGGALKSLQGSVAVLAPVVAAAVSSLFA